MAVGSLPIPQRSLHHRKAALARLALESLSGDIVSWCCAEGGQDVRRLVSAAECSLA